MGKIIDLIGQRFGRLVVVDKCGKDKNGKNTIWLCKCDCGGTTRATSTHLRNGHTQSCGCLAYEKRIKGGMDTRFTVKHNLSRTRLYRIWSGMKSRCYNPNAPKYNLYGGRGIFICNEWLQDFKAFYDWAMLNGYDDKLTIDRIDNDKGYTSYNCRWVTIAEQNKNRRCCKNKEAVR